MALVIYNTFTRRKEPFTPLNPGEVGMYVCGITAYDHAHVGHGRCYVAFDAILRHLKARGYRVKYVRNFTDIDDKIIARAAETGVDCAELAERFMASFSEDMAALGNLAPDVEPRATEHIPEMVRAVERLVEKGFAYVVEGGDVMFSVDAFRGYGKLSGRRLEEMMAGARVEADPRKRNPLDFVLWKAAKPGEPSWTSPWGPGRPGWHIECSVMSAKYLGQPFDIHGGGQDLIFPHHENELAQAEALEGRQFVRWWVHNGFVRVGEEKMSKSLGNFFTLKDVLKRVHPEALRLLLLSQHYRSPLQFSEAALEQAASSLTRLYTAMARAEEALGSVPEAPAQSLAQQEENEGPHGLKAAAREFEEAMDDDFNTARAIGALFTLARELNRAVERGDRALVQTGYELMVSLGGRLGLLGMSGRAFLQGGARGELGVDVEEVERLVAERAEARKRKDFATADRIRDQLKEMGIILEDTPTGTRWRLAEE